MALKKTSAKKSAKKVSRKLSEKSTDTIKKSSVKKATKAALKARVKKAAPAKKKAVKTSIEKSPVIKNTAISKKSVSAKKDSKRVVKRSKGQTEILLESVIRGLEEKKGKNISILDLRELNNRVSDYFLIAEGDSNTHVDAIAGSVEEIVKKETKERPYKIEGIENSEWIIIDYVNIVVHVFQREARSYYRLEELWADAKIQHI
jgi:ribosome-associated protein